MICLKFESAEGDQEYFSVSDDELKMVLPQKKAKKTWMLHAILCFV